MQLMEKILNRKMSIIQILVDIIIIMSIVMMNIVHMSIIMIDMGTSMDMDAIVVKMA